MLTKIKKTIIPLAAGALLLSSCVTDVNLKDVDPSAKLGVGIALPVGSLTATVGDFLKDTTIKSVYINEQGIYQFCDTFSYKKEFHGINLTRYFSSVNSKLKIKEHNGGLPMIADTGDDIVLEFPLGLKLSNVNNNLTSERLDKMFIERAEFSSVFNQNFGLDYSRIKKLEIILPTDHMIREAGQEVNVPISGHKYGDELPIIVDNFTINLLEDPSKPYDATTNKAQDSVTFNMRFTLRLNPSEVIPVDDNSAFDYTFSVDLLDYAALYGYFGPSDDMHDVDTMEIGKMWDSWNKLREFKIPIAEPELKLDITTAVAAPLHTHIEYLEVEEIKSHTVHKATFDDSKTLTTYDVDLPFYHGPDSPLDTRTKNTLKFNNEKGDITHIFEIRPDIVRYDYSLYPRYAQGVTQHRLTKDTKIDIDAILTIPFKLNEGTHLAFKDTIHAAMDSLSLQKYLENVEMIDSINFNDVKLVLIAQSWIPFDVKAHVLFLDKDFNDTGVRINEDNMVTIYGPTDYVGSAIQSPNQSNIIVDIDQSDLDKLAKAKEIAFDLEVTDVDVTKLKNKGAVFPIAIGEYTKLEVKVALSADVEAYLRLPFGDNGQKK